VAQTVLLRSTNTLPTLRNKIPYNTRYHCKLRYALSCASHSQIYKPTHYRCRTWSFSTQLPSQILLPLSLLPPFPSTFALTHTRSMSGLFSRSGGGGQRPPPQGPPQPRAQYDRLSDNAGSDRYTNSSQFGRAPSGYHDEKPRYPEGLPTGPGLRPQGGGGQRKPAPPNAQLWQLRPAKSPTNEYIFGNMYVVKPWFRYVIL
jgi:hypothetical protein